MTDRAAVVEAIEASWSAGTAVHPGEWSASNPAKGHCDVSSFVAWEFLGGDLVLGQVHLDGEFQEHHYWNRIDSSDLDLTHKQFESGEVITEVDVVASEFLAGNQHKMKADLRSRIATFRQAVEGNLSQRSA